MRRLILIASILFLISAEPTTQPSGLREPAKKELAFKLMSASENSTLDWKEHYAYIEYNAEGNGDDNRGYTGGVAGFSSKDGDMLELIEHFQILVPDNALAAFLPALRKVNGTAARTGLGKPFEEAWAAAAKDPKFRQAQDEEVDRVYFNPAMDAAKEDGLHELGQFIYFDAMMMHGEGNDEYEFGAIRAAALKKADPPTRAGDETKYLAAFLDVCKEAMINEEGKDVDTSRIDTMQRTFLNAGNLQLTPPLVFKVYGEKFEIPK